MDQSDDFLDQLSFPRIMFSAQRGNAQEQCNLAVFFEYQGNHNKAAYWYRLSAIQGIARAQHNLGCFFLNGVGVEKNFTEAYKWFSEASKQNYINSIYNLAFMHENGLGCNEDKLTAYNLYKKAAEFGDSDSQCKLALIYLMDSELKKIGIKSENSGWPVIADKKKSFELFESASRQGHKLSNEYLIKLGWRT